MKKNICLSFLTLLLIACLMVYFWPKIEDAFFCGEDYRETRGVLVSVEQVRDGKIGLVYGDPSYLEDLFLHLIHFYPKDMRNGEYLFSYKYQGRCFMPAPGSNRIRSTCTTYSSYYEKGDTLRIIYNPQRQSLLPMVSQRRWWIASGYEIVRLFIEFKDVQEANQWLQLKQ